MTLMPAVAQMMNNGSTNSTNSNTNQEKIIETTTVNKSDTSATSAENLIANAEVMTALKNLITVINSASVNSVNKDGDNIKTDSIPDISQILSGTDNAGNSDVSENNNPVNNSDNKIEKTLDTLKNISSATSPDNDHRTKLLLALKPFLKEGRQTKIDTALKYMNAAKIITMFGKNGFV
jgi:hypothetical protein